MTAIRAVSAAIRRGSHFLLVRRAREPSLGLFAFPGGKVEAGETELEAVEREVREETGLVIEKAQIFRQIELDSDATGRHYLLTIFVGSASQGEPVAGDDAAEAGWFTIDDMEAMPMTLSSLAVAREIVGMHAAAHER